MSVILVCLSYLYVCQICMVDIFVFMYISRTFKFSCFVYVYVFHICISLIFMCLLYLYVCYICSSIIFVCPSYLSVTFLCPSYSLVYLYVHHICMFAILYVYLTGMSVIFLSHSIVPHICISIIYLCLLYM